MRDPRDDVLNKMDALLKKHHATEPDIPVLTDIVEHPRINLNIIPVLTEEVNLTTASYATPAPLAFPEPEPEPEPDLAASMAEQAAPEALPSPPIEIDLVHPSALDKPPPALANANSVLERLEAVEAEVQAEIEARISQTQFAPTPKTSPKPSIEIPLDAHFIPLTPAVVTQPNAPAVPVQLPEDSAKQIAALVETDVARIIKKHLHQTLDEELSSMLNSALDKAISSMLEQFMVHMEEVVRTSIADELKKQLAPFKRPAPPSKP